VKRSLFCVNKINRLMAFSVEYTVLITVPTQEERCCTKKIKAKFPNKPWTLSGLNQVALLSQRGRGPRDASCLLVVSFNSTKRRAESFIVSYVGSVLFCCLWRNVETSCHKHFVVVSRHQQTPPLTTSDKYHNFRDRGPATSC